jgi:hypothetical protein
MTQPGSRPHLPVTAVLAALLFFLALCSLVVLNYLKYPLARFAEAGTGMGALPGFVLSNLRVVDWSILGLTAAAALAAAWLELRGGAVSRALAATPQKGWAWLCAAFVFWAVHSHLVPGLLIAGDASSHVSRITHFSEALRAGRALFWDNYFYLGCPLLQFTGPLFFWAASALDVIFRDATLSTKLLLAALHALSLVTFYRFARLLGVAALAAGAGSFVYGCAFAHQALLHWRGAYPQAVTLALLPLTCELALRVIRTPRVFSPSAAGLALCVAAQIVNHQASGLFAVLFAALLLLPEWLRRKDWQRALLPFTIAGIAAVAATLFAVIPFLRERAYVMMYESPHLIELVWPGIGYFRELLVWKVANPQGGDASVAYVGVTSAALAAVAVVAAVRGRLSGAARATVLAATGCLLLSFFLRGGHVRDIIYTLFFVALLAAFGAERLAATARPRVILAAACLLFLDIGTAAVQPHARTDKGFFGVAAARLERDAADRRVLVAGQRGGDISISIGPGGSPLLYAKVQQLTGAHNLTATLTHNYVAAAVKMAERDLRETGTLGPDAARALAMLNTAVIIGEQKAGLGLPEKIKGAGEEEALGRALRVNHPTPLLFARSLAVVDASAALDKPLLWNEDFARRAAEAVRAESFLKAAMDGMGVNPETKSADKIAVRAGVGEQPPQNDARRGGAWGGAVREYRVGFDEIRLVIESPEAGFAQLSHPWYPFLRVEQDGKRITPWRSAINLLVVPVHPGLNEYVITPARTPLRVYLGWLSAAVTLGLIAVCLLTKARKKAAS